MPDKGYTVVEGELRAFASALRSTADKVSGSANAVRNVSYSVTTWGIVGQLFSISARKATGDAAASLDKGAASIRDAATGVDNSAQAYADNDSHIATNGFGGGDQ
ncbi:type VII secretion target [Kibdelosporangium persicum]|uniref:Excreted virulence factor EspC, type VII ESX diderm n=1 Tax=Kibdelosporangium persicum TaxID=2698649 RepID=A0ABX2F5C9_9PSEU|nr:type VII secretion target [Kibdelosporangium persicum]NRN66151.1 Excreted virulence factor EspC, type VII ESX diderm [Kibdelosporangium persicum]